MAIPRFAPSERATASGSASSSWSGEQRYSGDSQNGAAGTASPRLTYAVIASAYLRALMARIATIRRLYDGFVLIF